MTVYRQPSSPRCDGYYSITGDVTPQDAKMIGETLSLFGVTDVILIREGVVATWHPFVQSDDEIGRNRSMTTQRDRLIAVLADTDVQQTYGEWADALIARGVRVVDADTLAAFSAWREKYGGIEVYEVEDGLIAENRVQLDNGKDEYLKRMAVLKWIDSALDGEADR